MAQLDWYIRTNLKPRHLQLLVALDDHRNVGAVAAALHVSQPAVSKTLGEMERGLGMRLFERTPRGVVPTIYGECLIRHARGVVAGLNQARDELRGLMSGEAGKTAVGALPAATPALMPHALALLKRKSPGTTVMVREGALDSLLPELRSGKLDLVVGALPQQALGADLDERRLFEERVCLVTGRAHPLARRKRLDWPDLRGFPWVLPPVGTLLREPLEATLERHQLPMPSDAVETISVHVMRTYLQLSQAVAVMQENVARHYAELSLLAVLPLELPRLVRPVGMAWSRQRALSPAARLMMECLQEAGRTLGMASRTPAPA